MIYQALEGWLLFLVYMYRTLSAVVAVFVAFLKYVLLFVTKSYDSQPNEWKQCPAEVSYNVSFYSLFPCFTSLFLFSIIIKLDQSSL